tara:strand:- start:336 stop:1361 length:1026 start_codon:yes stop_codon:yes gene_type:complete
MKKTALITGISGQDGAYLAQHLLKKNYKVIGAERRSASSNHWRLKELGINNDIEFIDFELTEFTNIFRSIDRYQPDEFYNLAAQSFVASSFETPTMTSDVTGMGVIRILESIRQINPKIKFYQASSSEMFGKVHETPQNENTLFHPRSPYGVAKLYGHWITVNYRESYDMFACSGILFNHESPLRGEEFVTRKITLALSRIKLGLQQVLELGNIEAKRDWGFAGDYVKGMHLMLNHSTPDDFVLSTNQTHTVREFIEISCKYLSINLEWKGSNIDEVGIDKDTGREIIKINPKFYRPSEVDLLLGDSSKAQKILGWNNETSFNDLVSMMIEADLIKAKKEI